jgi:hypothetical protein
MGTALLVLGLLPCLAFVVGAWRGAGRIRRDPKAPDTLLLGFVALSLIGYVVFTWSNPWFATLKGSYLLGLSLPFAWYASDVLARWSRVGDDRATLVWGMLATLAVLVAVTFTMGPVFEKRDGPGLEWRHFESK